MEDPAKYESDLRIMYAYQFYCSAAQPPRIVLARSLKDAFEILEDMGLDAVSIVRVGEVL